MNPYAAADQLVVMFCAATALGALAGWASVYWARPRHNRVRHVRRAMFAMRAWLHARRTLREARREVARRRREARLYDARYTGVRLG